MRKLFYIFFAVLVVGLIYMITMPFIMLYEDHAEEIEVVEYYVPDTGLESLYHREVELTKGMKQEKE